MSRAIDLDQLLPDPVEVTLGGHKFTVRGDLHVHEIAAFTKLTRGFESDDADTIGEALEAANEVVGGLLSEFLPAGENPPPLGLTVRQVIGLFTMLASRDTFGEEVIKALNGDEEPTGEAGTAGGPLASAKDSPTASAGSPSDAELVLVTSSETPGAASAPKSPTPSQRKVPAKG